MKNKQKDPAFLLYSKDFYEGTRLMLPEERGIYIDLMIYQHQHEYIPNNLKRISMYCSGSTEAMLKAVLDDKFKLCENGWYNEKLKVVIDERRSFSEKQSVNGIIGQFWKKSKSLLSNSEFSELRIILSGINNNNLLLEIKDKEINKAMLIAMLKAKHKHLEDENEYEDEDNISNSANLIFTEKNQDNLINEIKNSDSWKNTTAMNYKISIDKLNDQLAFFLLREKTNENLIGKTLKDVRIYFCNFLNKNIEKPVKKTPKVNIN